MEKTPVEVMHEEDPIEAASFAEHWAPGKDPKKDPACITSFTVVGHLE